LVRLAERAAAEIRAVAGVNGQERFDPWQLADRFGVQFAAPDDILGLSPADRDLIAKLDARTWSGAGLPLADGRTLVILNPHQTLERKSVTVMEEISHVHFHHAPSHLERLPNGLVRREYDPQSEREAYWTAAATLLPAEVVSRAVWRSIPPSELSSDYGVSEQLAVFRIKILNLWKHCKGLLSEAS